MVGKRPSLLRLEAVERGFFSFPCLLSVPLADVVIAHDSAAPIGRTSCSKPGASTGGRWEPGGWREECLVWRKQEGPCSCWVWCELQGGSRLSFTAEGLCCMQWCQSSSGSSSWIHENYAELYLRRTGPRSFSLFSLTSIHLTVCRLTGLERQSSHLTKVRWLCAKGDHWEGSWPE